MLTFSRTWLLGNKGYNSGEKTRWISDDCDVVAFCLSLCERPMRLLGYLVRSFLSFVIDLCYLCGVTLFSSM